MDANRSLYLRWRPRKFGEVVAQEPITRTLRNAVARGTVAHAYLLCGPRGTGKTSIARILYRALNCLNPTDGEPCGSCASCRAVDEGRAIDLIEMDAASHGGIDDVRDLRERVYFAPVDAKSKVYIVDEAHQLTTRAWDAFLKTLEEPPPRTVFVLATTEAHRVPATIISRCQRFDLRRIPQGRLAEQLEKVAAGEGIALEAGVAERLARLARGSLRDGESMLEQVAAFAGSSVTMEEARTVLGLARGDALRSYLDALSVGDAPRALQLVEDLADEGADLRQFLDELLVYLRGTLLSRSGAASALETSFGPEERGWLSEIAQRWAPGQILGILRAFGEIESRGRDEHHVIVRTELVTAWAASMVERATGSTVAVHGPVRAEVLEARGPRPPTAVETSETGEEVRPSRVPVATGDVATTTADPGAANPALSVSPAASTSVRLSVAGLQAAWPNLVDALQTSLLSKMRLRSFLPTALDQQLVTLAGPLDPLDVQRLDNQELRSAIEGALQEIFGVHLRIRFRQSDAATAVGPNTDDAPGSHASPIDPGRATDERTGSSLAELGSSLFGGHLVAEN
ncbi:MAG: DNA polymerase III subunit gamma/tau [Chloroflexi bacterium]|nr:DNA polymerase III subunit gamma/tau [Chloroflexota bacterium]